MSKKHPVKLYFDKEVLDWIDEKCKQTGLDRSNYVRMTLHSQKNGNSNNITNTIQIRLPEKTKYFATLGVAFVGIGVLSLVVFVIKYSNHLGG